MPYRHLRAAEILARLCAHSSDQLEVFRASWEDLPVDRYMKDGGDYRRRRYGAFRGVDRMEPIANASFYQPEAINAVNGGIRRHFAPLSDEFAGSPLLGSLVRLLADLLPGEFDRTGAVGIHQIRITADRNVVALPAPEGIHEDGHHFVAQVLIGRHGVVGGSSRIYDRALRLLFQATLTEPFESIIIDDRRVLHGVDAIRPSAEKSIGVRDMLLVDFFPMTDE